MRASDRSTGLLYKYFTVRGPEAVDEEKWDALCTIFHG